MPVGRPPKPTAERLLNGNPGKRPLPPDEPQFSGVPVMPDWLDEDAQVLWQSVVPQLVAAGVAKETDSLALAGMCRWWAVWRGLDRVVASGEVNYKTVCCAGMAWKHFATVACKFGLTPSDRVRLKADPPAKPDDDPLLAMMRKRAEKN